MDKPLVVWQCGPEILGHCYRAFILLLNNIDCVIF